MNKVKGLVFSGLLFSPLLAFAAGGFSANYLTTFLNEAKTVLGNVVPILVTLAIIFFFWELITFIRNKDKGDASKAESAKNGLVWSLVAIFVMLSFLGIVRILQSATGTQNPGDIDRQDVPVVSF